MANYSTNCTPSFPPTPENLTSILACQSAALTPFCWPPNNTRICIPTDKELTPFYWPQAYYHNDAKLALETNPGSSFLLSRNNTGNSTTYFTPYEYESLAKPIDGVQYEKAIQVYMRERRFDASAKPYNLQLYDGPTIILVKTAAFPTTTRSWSLPSSTSRPSSSYGSYRKELSMGDIAGIVVGATAGLAFLILLVFCLMRCARPKRDRGVPPDRGELQRRAEEGERLMMVQGGSSAWKNRLQGVNEEALMGTRANEDDIRRRGRSPDRRGMKAEGG